MTTWTDEQLLAINKENTNIIVSASAGSGKTAVLTERVIRKLKSGVKIDELLILTFTKAAAKEMKERIKDKIIEEGLLENLKLLDKSYITTFDSYALSIVKKYHYILNISPSVSIEEGGILKIQAKKILNEIMDERYELKEPKFIKFIQDFCLKDDEDLKKLLLNLNEKLDLRMDKKEYLNSYINKFYSDSYIDFMLEDYKKLINTKKSDLKNLIHYISYECESDYYNSLCASLEKLIEANTYDEIKSSLTITLPRIPKNSTDNLKELKDKISKKIDEIIELCCFDNEKEMKQLYLKTKDNNDVIISILIELDEKLDVFKEKNELYSFNDIAKKAIKVIKENNYIRSEMKNYFNEIMVDEYQDTSDIQEEFINLIENNNVYMVGDIKQSIYRFRNANPYIFKNKYDNYKNNNGGFKIDLSKNFRSRKEVIEDINEVFSPIMDDKIGGADYINEHAMVFGNFDYINSGNNNIENNLEIYKYDYDKDTAYSKEEIEIFIIANDIKNKVKNNYPVMDKKTKLVRPVTYNDFVILMDKSKSFSLYKKIFEYLEIPLSIMRDESLLNNDHVGLIRNLCELVLLEKNKTYDSTYAFDFLSLGRSYLFDYTDQALFDMVTTGNYMGELKDVIQHMCDYTNESLSIFLTELFKSINIYDKLVKIGDIDENLTVLDYILTTSSSFANLGYNLNDFVAYLTDLKEQGLDLKYAVSDQFSNSVKIMTIHGSKGLEYAICYYTGLYSKFNIRELNEKILFSDHIVIPYVDGYFRHNIDYYLLKSKYLEEEISEEIRLFYVALTRAREKMIIVTSLEDKNILKEKNIVMDRLQYRSFYNILCSIKDNLEKYITEIDITKIPITKKYQFSKDIKFESTEDEKLVVSEIHINNEEIDDTKFSKEQKKLITEDEMELFKFGTKVHEIFENLDFDNPDFENISLPPYLIDKIKSFFKTELFNGNIINIYKEYEFIDNNTLGIIDLILETDSTLKVVDYKLKNIDDDAYVNQLKGYANYLKKVSDKKIELYLYSILNEELKQIKNDL